MQTASLPPRASSEGEAALRSVPISRPAANSDVLGDRPALAYAGRYTLKAPLGEGLFGGVYAAWDPLLSRSVAIRTLQFGLKMSSRIIVDRLLLDAARAAAELHHRHIVAVCDAGLSAHGVYIAMDYLEGRDLARALQEGWRPTVGEALRLARRLADGLAHAHARGVVHGDVEPGNIFLTRSGRPKLMNFGIARAIDRHPVPELAEVRLATPNGQAPETLAQGRYDELTDVYSLGVVLYELLSGRRPFRADSPEGLRQAIAVGRHVALSEWRPDLPQPLVHLVHAAMACDRAARPASAQALASALKRLSGIEGASSDAYADPRRPQLPARRRHWALRWAFPRSG